MVQIKYHCKKFALSLCLFTLLLTRFTATAMTELNEDNLPKDVLGQFEFSILNFYDDSAQGKEIVEIFARAEQIYFSLNPQVNANRIVWAQLDYPNQPKMHFQEDNQVQIPNQFIFGLGIMRQLRFERNKAADDEDLTVKDESIEQAAERFAQKVLVLTRDYFKHISCDEIEEVIKEEQPIFVYFGPPGSLYNKGNMAHLARVVLKDRFSYQEAQKIEFYFNDDPKCKAERQFEEDMPAVALYVHPDVPPFVLQSPDDNLSYEYLSVWLSKSIIEFSALWSHRANDLVFEFHQSALLYIMPDNFENMSQDWIAVQLMPGVQDFLRERNSGLIPLVTTLTNDPAIEAQRGLESIKDIFEIETNDLPWVYMLHGQTGSVVPYPYELKDAFDASPQTIVLWARRVMIMLELPELENSSEGAGKAEDFEAQKQILELMAQAEEELEIVNAKFEEFRKELSDIKEKQIEKAKKEAQEKDANAEIDETISTMTDEL